MRVQRVLCRGNNSQGFFSDIDESKLDSWDLWLPPDSKIMPWGGGLKIANILFVKNSGMCESLGMKYRRIFILSPPNRFNVYPIVKLSFLFMDLRTSCSLKLSHRCVLVQ